jgi:hypothetical protein
MLKDFARAGVPNPGAAISTAAQNITELNFLLKMVISSFPCCSNKVLANSTRMLFYNVVLDESRFPPFFANWISGVHSLEDSALANLNLAAA